MMSGERYSTGIERALREGAITVYGERNGEVQSGEVLFPRSALAGLPPIYRTVVGRTPGDFQCLMVQPSVREAAEASRYPNHRARVQAVGSRAVNPWMFPHVSVTPDMHSRDTLRTEELLAMMQRSTVEAVRKGVRRAGRDPLLSADALCLLPLTLEKGGRGNEVATAQQTTFLSPIDDPFLVHQHIGSFHEVPAEKLGGPFPLIYLSTRARLRDLIGLPKSLGEGEARRRECARKIVSLLSEGGIALCLGGIDERIRRALASCLEERDNYLIDPQADLILRGGSDFTEEVRASIAGRERPARVFDIGQVFQGQKRAKGNT